MEGLEKDCNVTKKEETKTSIETEQQENLNYIVWKRRELYGGAISIVLPHDWRDVSVVRQIPDFQEVYQDFSSSSRERSLVVEILQREDTVKDADAAAYFLKDLVEKEGDEAKLLLQNVWTVGTSSENNNNDDDTTEKMIIHMSSLSISAKASTCISKIITPSSTHPKTKIELCVLRLVPVETDLLIMLNSSYEPKKLESQKQQHSKLFQSIVNSFQIHDWSLFV